MLVLRHRRNIDEVPFLLVPSLAVVNIVAATLNDKNLLFRHMSVLSRSASGGNLLQVEPTSSRCGLHFRMNKPLQSSLPGALPRLLFAANDVRYRAAKLNLVVKQLEMTIIGILERVLPGPSPVSTLENRLDVGLCAEIDFDILFDSSNAFFDSIPDHFPLVVLIGSVPSGKVGFSENLICSRRMSPSAPVVLD